MKGIFTMDTKVKELVTSSMAKIHEMADANTILGTPVKIDNEVTIIPVSKVSYGFAGGGSDLPSKSDKELFGGGSGAGITITPMGFLVVSGGDVQLLQMNLDVSASSAVINMVPEVFNKVADLFKKKDDGKNGKKSKATAEKTADPAAANDTDDIEIPESMLDKNQKEPFDFD